MWFSSAHKFIVMIKTISKSLNGRCLILFWFHAIRRLWFNYSKHQIRFQVFTKWTFQEKFYRNSVLCLMLDFSQITIDSQTFLVNLENLSNKALLDSKNFVRIKKLSLLLTSARYQWNQQHFLFITQQLTWLPFNMNFKSSIEFRGNACSMDRP